MLFKIIGGIVIVVVIIIIGSYFSQNIKPKEIKVITEKKEYQLGEALKIKIENNLKKVICFSSCYPYYFEKKDGGWISYHYESCPNSDLVDSCINPKQVKAYEIVTPALKTGLHRLALPACLGCSAQEKFHGDKWLYSNEFILK